MPNISSSGGPAATQEHSFVGFLNHMAMVLGAKVLVGHLDMEKPEPLLPSSVLCCLSQVGPSLHANSTLHNYSVAPEKQWSEKSKVKGIPKPMLAQICC